MARTREGTAVRQRGLSRASEILDAAKSILVREGLASLSIRRVADELGISVGNLAYYFPSKDALLDAIISHIIDGYDTELEKESESFPDEPRERFKAFLRYLIEDAKKSEVQGFFYQFWGMSTHNPQTAVARERMYQHFAEQTVGYIRDIHPGRKRAELELMALSILTCLEGLNIVYGSGKILRNQSRSFDRHIFHQMLRMADADDTGA